MILSPKRLNVCPSSLRPYDVLHIRAQFIILGWAPTSEAIWTTS
jgi:hypothetical protein